MMDRRELIARDLAMYLTTPCACNARYRIVAMVFANGVRQYRLRCVECDHLCGGSILHAKLTRAEIEAAAIVASHIGGNKCARCGQWSNGVELHHWAPAAVFQDFDCWPTSWLCAVCHNEWHQRMNGYSAPRPARSARFEHGENG